MERPDPAKVRPSSKPPEDGIYGDGKECAFKIKFIENSLLFSERFPRSLDWSLAWRREVIKISIRALFSVTVIGRKEGFTEIGISRTISPRWNAASWRLGRISCFGSVGNL